MNFGNLNMVVAILHIFSDEVRRLQEALNTKVRLY